MEEEGLPSPQRQHSLGGGEGGWGGETTKKKKKKKKVKTQKHFIKCRSVFLSRPSSVGVSATSLGGYMQKVNTWNYTWRVTSDICASIKKIKKKIRRCNLANEGFGSRAGRNKGRVPAETSWISPSHRLTRVRVKSTKRKSYASPPPHNLHLHARFCTTKYCTSTMLWVSGRSVLSEASCHSSRNIGSDQVDPSPAAPPCSPSIPRATEKERGGEGGKRTMLLLLLSVCFSSAGVSHLLR